MPKMKFDFYEVVLPRTTPQVFEQLIDMLHSSTNDESRVVEYYDQTLIRFQHGLKENDLYVGEMLRIRMQQIPSKAKVSGEVNPIDLASNEGVGEPTMFLFDPITRTIVIQKSQAGVAPTAIRHYFEAKTKVVPMSFNPRLQKETMQKLGRMRQVKALEVTVASVTDTSFLQGRVSSVGQALSAINGLGAPTISLKISAGRGKRADLGAAAKEEAHAMLDLNTHLPGAVQKLVITGDIEGLDKPDPLDLLEDKMIERIELPPLTGRGYSYGDRKNAIFEAWERRKVEILSMIDRTQ
jgi:hypothetical protein